MVMSPEHRKLLARLVARYGRDVVAREAMKVRRTPRTGPPRQSAPWDDVCWIEERADELGGYGAIKQAIAERFLAVTPRAYQSDEALRKFARRVKRTRDLWSKTQTILSKRVPPRVRRS